jgi:XTP/dITP diphosphohydrolase
VALPDRLVLASANPKKVGEIRAILGEQVHLVARPPEVPDVVEDADTFEGNARLKAVALVEATGLAALADDSGLEVDALEGRPGVRSARFAGEGASDADNVAKLLADLDAMATEQRRARFRAVLVLRWPDGAEVVVAGAVEGTIARQPRGDGGFGYDPVFVPDDGDGRTFAQMAAADKHAISHRGRALRSMVSRLTG